MTQQTTAERIAELMLRSVEQSIIDFDHVFDADPVARTIAAEIDALTRERDEALAEVERLRPAAEAWDKREALVAASKLRDAALWEPGAPNLDRYRVTKSAWLVAEEEAETAAARARAAKGTP